jgi:hypothetical protein
VESGLLKPFAKAFSVFNRRYVNRFIPVVPKLTAGSVEVTAEGERVIAALRQAISQIRGMLDQYPKISELDELIYMHIVDLGLKLSIPIKDGDAQVNVGWDLDVRPDFVLDLYSQNIRNLVQVSGGQRFDLNAVYRIIRVLFIPFLRGLYQADYAHLPEDKSYLQLDNFIQVEVVPETPVEVEGFPGPARATVVNVDHQWLIFEGWQGDPDIRYSMNVEQAVQFAYLIRVKMGQKDLGMGDFRQIVAEYNALKKETMVYERDWH